LDLKPKVKIRGGEILPEILLYLGTYLSAGLFLGWLVRITFDPFIK